jgi:methylation protein EvaC
MHIPIVPYEQFCNDDVRHVLLLAWNHKDEIFKKEIKFRNNGGKFIIYFPKVQLE